jgi:hypothetical protein
VKPAGPARRPLSRACARPRLALRRWPGWAQSHKLLQYLTQADGAETRGKIAASTAKTRPQPPKSTSTPISSREIFRSEPSAFWEAPRCQSQIGSLGATCLGDFEIAHDSTTEP